MELVWIWESSERWEEVLQDLVDQTKASLDVMELFIWGEYFLRFQEMGKPEGPVSCIISAWNFFQLLTLHLSIFKH